MSTIQPNLQSISGHIDQFRKITPTLATFRVNRIACKAEHHAVAYVERWSMKPDCVYEFQGAYQQSRFGREFVVAHGRPEKHADEPFVQVADKTVLSEEKAIEEYGHEMRQWSPDLLTPKHLHWQMEHGPEAKREAARRLLQRVLQVEAPSQSGPSPSIL